MKLLRELFRKKLNALPLADQQPDWESLRNRLDAKQGRRFFFFGKSIFFLAAALMMISASAYFILLERSPLGSGSSQQTQHQLSSKGSSSGATETRMPVSTENNSSSVSAPEQSQTNTSGKIALQHSSTNRSQSAQAISRFPPTAPSSTVSAEGKKSNNSLAPDQLGSTAPASGTIQPGSPVSSAETDEVLAFTGSSNQVGIPSENDKSRETPVPVLQNSSDEAFRPVSVASNPWQKLTIKNAENSLNTKTQQADPVYNKRRFSFYLGAEVGMQWNMQDKHSVYDNALMNRYHTSEKNRASVTGGLSFTAQRKGFTLSSGVNYFSNAYATNYENAFYRKALTDSTGFINIQRLNQQVDTSWMSFVSFQQGWSTTDTSIFYYDPSSGTMMLGNAPLYVANNTSADTIQFAILDTTYLIENDSVSVVYQVQKVLPIRLENASGLRRVQSFSFVEVPLLAGYSFQSGKWAIQLGGGASISFYHRHEAIYMKDDLSGMQPVHASRVRRIGYHFLTQAGVSRRLAGPWELSMNLRNRMDLNPLYRDANLSRRFNATGLLVGLRYRL